MKRLPRNQPLYYTVRDVLVASATELRLREIHADKQQMHDVEVMAV